MAGFFSRSRKQDYHGFSKYLAELPESGTVAGLPRSQSLSNGAGQAAAAALRMHSHQPIQTTNPPQQHYIHHHNQSQQNQHHRIKRTNSLSSANRSNSLKQYVYHPTGSYIPGGGAKVPVAGGSRHSSLTAASPRPVSQPPKPYGQYHQVTGNKHNHNNHNNNHNNSNDDDEEEVEVVTTKTTKVVDYQGRVISINTTTIRRLPDGSNVIETTTKNISRSNSRANSLNSANVRTASLLSIDNPINLTKIDEDLHDFEYNYELDTNRLGNRNNLKLNLPEDPILEEHENAAILQDIKSGETSPIKPLRSILKNSHPPKFEQEHEDSAEFKDAVESQGTHLKSGSHPYKAISGDPLQPPKLTALSSPPTSHRPPNQKSPRARNGDEVSSSSSIKFDDKVETIPIYSKALGKPFVPATTKPKVNTVDGLTVDADFYAAAMQAAYKKVYGENAQAPESQLPISTQETSPLYQMSPRNGRTYSLSSNLSSFVDNRPRQKRPQPLQGKPTEEVGDKFQYENHHKDFVKHSLRESLPKSSTRKERSKEEKRYLKQVQAENELAEKQARKEAKHQLKLAKKDKKNSSEGSSFLGLFGRRKSSISSPPRDFVQSFPPVVADSALPEEVFRDSSKGLRPDFEPAVPIESVPESVISIKRKFEIPQRDGRPAPDISEQIEKLDSKPPLITGNSITYHAPSDATAAFQENPLSNDVPETTVVFPREAVLAAGPTIETEPTPISLDETYVKEPKGVQAPQTLIKTAQAVLSTRQETLIEPEQTLVPPPERIRAEPKLFEKVRELENINTTSSSPYLSASHRGASSPNEYETVDEELDDVHKSIPVPKLNSVEAAAEYESDEEYENKEATLDRSALKRAILGSPKGTAPDFQEPQTNYEGPLPIISGSSTELSGLKQDYAVVAAYIEGDTVGTESRIYPANAREDSFTGPSKGASVTSRDEANNRHTTAPLIEDSITVVEPPHEFVPGSEHSQRGLIHTPEQEIKDPVTPNVGRSHVPVRPARANVTEPLPNDTTIPEVSTAGPEPVEAIEKPNTGVINGRNPESPGDDKSTVPTIASQKSDQPTNSTVATEHQQPALVDNPESEVVAVSEKETKSKKKAKKPSKFKEKMFKYFVTSYDNNNK